MLMSIEGSAFSFFINPKRKRWNLIPKLFPSISFLQFRVDDFFSVPSHFQVYKIKIRYEILNDESTAEEYDWNTQIHADQHIHGNKTSVENKKAHSHLFEKSEKTMCIS